MTTDAAMRSPFEVSDVILFARALLTSRLLSLKLARANAADCGIDFAGKLAKQRRLVHVDIKFIQPTLQASFDVIVGSDEL